MAANDVNIRIKAVDASKEAFNSVNKSLSGLKTAMLSVQGVIGGLITAQTIRNVANLADSYVSVTSRLRLVTQTTQDYKDAQQQLFAISQKTRTGYAETVDLFTTLSRSTKSLGVSQEEVIKLTENINKALIVSGASGASAQAALVQLAQGFAGGALRGQEFMSVAEQAPMILDVLSRGLGLTRGELKRMADEGKLTTETFLKGFTAGSQQLSTQFEAMPTTIGGAMTQLGNVMLVTVGQLDAATGASKTLTSAFTQVGDSIKTFGEFVAKHKTAFAAVVTFAGVSAGLLAVAGAISVITGALGVMAATIMANPILAAIVLGGGALAALYQSLKSAPATPARLLNDKWMKTAFPAQKAKQPGESEEDYMKRIRKEWNALTEAEQKNITGMTAWEKQGRSRNQVMEDTAKTLGEFQSFYDSMGYNADIQEMVGGLINDNDVTRAANYAAQLAYLDKLYFELGLDAQIYDAAVKQLTQSSVTAGTEGKNALVEYAKAAQNVKSNLQDMAMSGIKTLEDSLVGLATGAMSAADAFRNMASSIISDLIRIQIQKNITGPLASFVDGFLSGGGKAIGGSVQSGQAYMVGERGPEMFVPNQSGSIVSNDKLSSGGGVTVVQTINVTTGVQQTVRAEIMTMMPQIANAAKAAVADAKLRGGSYAAALR